MSKEIRTRAYVGAVASFLPEGVLTNEQLAAELGDWEPGKILEKTGIGVRHVAAPDECASDLGVEAARRLFESGACAPEEVDFLLFCTQSPDYFLPTTSCIMQSRLGLRTGCGAADFNQGCSGYVYGLAFAKGLIESGSARNVLLVTAETYSKFVNPRDRSVRTIFGDGAAATLVSARESDEELLGPFVFGTDGRGASNLIVPSGGARRAGSAGWVAASGGEAEEWRNPGDLYMNGPEIFNFTLQTVPRATTALLERGGVTAEDVDLFVLHQANKFMLERLRAKMKIPESKFWLDMEASGNTVSSTIPIALEAAGRQGRLKAGARAALVGFGVGYSWAAALVRSA
jgi:3-oxoacyl-[acyl-carrier-protein] synthase III